MAPHSFAAKEQQEPLAATPLPNAGAWLHNSLGAICLWGKGLVPALPMTAGGVTLPPPVVL